MTIRNHDRSIQGPSTQHGARLFHILQDRVMEATGIDCTILVDMDKQQISIRTKDYSEYLQARLAIKGMTSMNVIRDSLEK